MALTKEDLQAIGALLDVKLDEKLKPINDRLDNLETKVDKLQTTVESHRDLTLEFYGKQMEHNTMMEDKIDFIDARVDIFENQTIKNATEIRKIRRA